MSDQTESDDGKKQPFIGSADRPEVRLDLDMPVTELRVRDLAAILGHLGTKSPFEVGKTPIKDFFDKPFPEEAKDFLKEIKIEKIEKPEKPEKVEKLEKLEKLEKYEKHEKHEKPEKIEKPEKLEKPEKFEKWEKREIKELKIEKIENDGTFDPGSQLPPGPDPRLEGVIQAIAGLTRQVSALADQVQELRKRVED